MTEGYDVQAVEAKWREYWADHGTYEIDESDPRPKFYALCMYPYPSGPIHMGHVRNYTLGDVLVRYKTMHGLGVLSLGWQATADTPGCAGDLRRIGRADPGPAVSVSGSHAADP